MIGLLLNLVSTWYMIGLIWFVQVVHYPLFAAVSPMDLPAYERKNTRLTAWVVIPPMLLELGSTWWLWCFPPAGIPASVPWIGLGLLLLIWASTFWLQVPQHKQLSGRFEPLAHQILVQTNWIRTLAWTLRGLVLLVTVLILLNTKIT